jgi:hypothetical protein
MAEAASFSGGGAGPSLVTSSGTPTVQTQVTNYTWAQTVLKDAGLPVTDNNVTNIVRWMTAEEPASDWYHANNPLNINSSGAGFDTLSSLTDGAKATATYLNMPNYRGIKAALANNASPSDFSAAVVASPWAASHYGVAAAGAPSQYIVTGRGTDYIANLGTPPVVAVSGQTLQAGSPGSQGGAGDGAQSAIAGTCGAKGGGFGFSFLSISSPKIFTVCQVKAISGGLLVGIGAVVGLAGLVLLGATGLSDTKVGKTAIGVASSKSPVGKVAQGVSTTVRQTAPKLAQRRQDRHDSWIERQAREADLEAPRRRQELKKPRVIEMPEPGMAGTSPRTVTAQRGQVPWAPGATIRAQGTSYATADRGKTVIDSSGQAF